MLKGRLLSNNAFCELAEELTTLVEVRGSQAACLDILNTLPLDIQPEFVYELTLSENPKLIPFLGLVVKEKTGEVQRVAKRALRKFALLGYNTQDDGLHKHPFDNIKAYISPTRFRGFCILMFLVQRINGEHDAHYFKLKFNHLGIKEYFQYSSLTEKELLAIVDKQGLDSIDLLTARRILGDAYSQNLRYGTKVAGGFQKYKNLLDHKKKDSKDSVRIILNLKEKLLDPNRLLNAYLLALKNLDLSLIYDLASDSLRNKYGERQSFLKDWNYSLDKYTILKSSTRKLSEQGKYIRYHVDLVASDEKDELRKIGLNVCMSKVQNQYLIDDISIEKIKKLASDDEDNPLNYHVFNKIYKMKNIGKIKKYLEDNKHINIVGELEDKICYKWFKNVDPLEKGINFLQNIYGEFILSKEELIVYANELKSLTEICNCLENSLEDSLAFCVKGMCNIREIYKLISSSEKFSEDEVFKEQNSFIIPEENYDIFYKYCLENNKNTYNINDVKVFNINFEDNILEVMFYGKIGIINLFTSDIVKLRKKGNLPNVKIYKTDDLCNSLGPKNNWRKLKTINHLKQNSCTKIYVQDCTVKSLASKYQVI